MVDSTRASDENVCANGREFTVGVNLHFAAGHEHWVALVVPTGESLSGPNVRAFAGWSEANVREQALRWMTGCWAERTNAGLEEPSAVQSQGISLRKLVDGRRIELLTSALRTRRSPS